MITYPIVPCRTHAPADPTVDPTRDEAGYCQSPVCAVGIQDPSPSCATQEISKEMGKGNGLGGGGGGVPRHGVGCNGGFDQLGGPIPVPSPRRTISTSWSKHRESAARATITASLGHATPRGHGGGGVGSMHATNDDVRQAARSSGAPNPGDVGASASIQWAGNRLSLTSRCSSAGSSNTSGDLDSSCKSASSRDVDSTTLDLTSLTSTDITAVQRYFECAQAHVLRS